MYIVENKYDRLYQIPKLEAGELTVTQELIAQYIIKKALLRISDDAACNFINLPLLNGKKNISFSEREIFNKEFSTRTEKTIKQNLTYEERQHPEQAVKAKLNFIKKELRKFLPITAEVELKIARMLAQSSHPAILQNIINEEVKIFVSFSHSISDLLGMQNWQQNRNNSGMQSVSVEDIAIYISCSGNPFIDPEKSEYTGDGFNAMARFMIVAAQEIGHFADIKKTQGYSERFSLNYRTMSANTDCDRARQKDLETVNKIKRKLERSGLEKLVELENKVEVQSKYRQFSLSLLILRFYRIFFNNMFKIVCGSRGLSIHNNIKNQKKLGNEIVYCISDFLFNLNPKADAYRYDNKRWENAIACAEALARVPQQKIKWGHANTKALMPEMSKIFYGKVIPEEIKFYQKSTGKRFVINNSKSYIPIYKSLLNKLRKLSGVQS